MLKMLIPGLSAMQAGLYGGLAALFLAMGAGLWFAVGEVQAAREELGVVRAAAAASDAARANLEADAKRRERAYLILKRRHSQASEQIERYIDYVDQVRADACADHRVHPDIDRVFRKAFAAARAGDDAKAVGAVGAMPDTGLSGTGSHQSGNEEADPSAPVGVDGVQP